jgi:hypothetical protein
MRPSPTSLSPEEKLSILLDTIGGIPESNAQIEMMAASVFATLPFRRPSSISLFNTAQAPPANRILDRAAHFNPIRCNCPTGAAANYILSV